MTVTNAPLPAEVGGQPPPHLPHVTAPCPSLLSHPGAPVLSKSRVRIHLKITDPLFTRRELGQEFSLVA